jgi:hypothetical protein
MSYSEKYKINTPSGDKVEIQVSLSDYEAAAKMGLSLSQYLSRKFGDMTDEVRYGPVMGQIMQNAGLYLSADQGTGIRPPSIAEIMSGVAGMQVGAIVRPDGSSNTPSARLLFPEIIMQVIESELRADNGDFLGGFDNLIATTTSITSPKFEQPIINVKAPESSDNNVVTQLAEPTTMVGITTSDVNRSIPTESIGLVISDQALGATTLDLVNVVMAAQARAKRVRMAEAGLKAVLNGDTDLKLSALSTRKANTLDSTISTAGVITHKALVKYLRTNYQKRSITNIVTDIDTALAIEARTGKPTQQSNYLASPEANFQVNATVDNLLVAAPRILLVDPTILGANTIMGLDNRYALRRVINVAASYSAIETYVMRRGQALRVDFGEMVHRLFDDAFDVLTLTI